MPPIPRELSSAAAADASSSRSPATNRCAARRAIGFSVTCRCRRGLPAAHTSTRLTITPPGSRPFGVVTACRSHNRFIYDGAPGPRRPAQQPTPDLLPVPDDAWPRADSARRPHPRISRTAPPHPARPRTLWSRASAHHPDPHLVGHQVAEARSQQRSGQVGDKTALLWAGSIRGTRDGGPDPCRHEIGAGRSPSSTRPTPCGSTCSTAHADLSGFK